MREGVLLDILTVKSAWLVTAAVSLNIIWHLSGSESDLSSFLMCDHAFLKSVDLLPCHCCAHLCYLRLLVCVATTSSSGLVLCASHNQILNKSGKRERAYVTEEWRRVLVSSSQLYVWLQWGANADGSNGQICFLFRRYVCTARTRSPCPRGVVVQGQSVFSLYVLSHRK